MRNLIILKGNRISLYPFLHVFSRCRREFFSCLEEKQCYDLSAAFKAERSSYYALIKDENGNLIQHGHEHTHQHTHADGVSHTHAHTHDGTEVMTIHIMRDRTAVQTAAAAREGTAGMRQ